MEQKSGQGNIANILKKNYPRYVSCIDITKITNTSDRSVHRCLRSMIKRDEVEFIMIQGELTTSGWIKKFRIKGGK